MSEEVFFFSQYSEVHLPAMLLAELQSVPIAQQREPQVDLTSGHSASRKLSSRSEFPNRRASESGMHEQRDLVERMLYDIPKYFL